MTKVGADDYVTATGATADTLEALPRAEIAPLIHLVDLERTEYVGRLVQTDIVIAGVGETFHVPGAWEVTCGKDDCTVCPRTIDLGTQKALLNFCRMSDDQKLGFMRRLSGCRNKPTPRATKMATITELLALPAASTEVGGALRDYREKVIALVGSLATSHVRYRAAGEVIAEPKRQRAALLIKRLTRLKSATERFVLTPALAVRFRVLQISESSALDRAAVLETAHAHVLGLTRDITRHITKIYGLHRETILLGELLTFHSVAEIPWENERIKGVIDGLVIGDTGQGKTTQAERLVRAIELGHLASGSTASRAGVLYSLDSKINDRRVLRWGAFPLAHGEALLIDEAQNITRENWREFTTARSEGLLKVERSIRAEHPCRVRLLCFANPLKRQAMAEFQYGIMAVHPEFGFLDPQDLRRFDFVACVSVADHTADEISTASREERRPQLVLPALLHASILWAWTRRSEQVVYAPETPEAICAMATVLNEKFSCVDIPLLITDAPEKVARLAVAFATFLHSTDVAHEQVLVTPVHVGLVGRFFEAIYTHANCALDQYAAIVRGRASVTPEECQAIAADLLTRGSNREDSLATEAMLDLLLTDDEFARADLEAATGLGKDALNARLRKVRHHKLVQSGKRGYRKTPRGVAFLRWWAERR